MSEPVELCLVCGRTDAWPEIAHPEVWCPHCGGPLPQFFAESINHYNAWQAVRAKRAP